MNILDDFCDYYKALTLEKVRGLGDIYDVDACFKDPVHEIKGLKNIKRYFELLLTNISYCEFNIEQILEQENQAFLTWEMNFAHRKLNHGQAIVVQGVSQLKFNRVITFHRDYYDLGEMVYEQVPFLKSVIKKLKGNLKG